MGRRARERQKERMLLPGGVLLMDLDQSLSRVDLRINRSSGYISTVTTEVDDVALVDKQVTNNCLDKGHQKEPFLTKTRLILGF